MKYFLIAGEPSGDLHAANLVKAIKNIDPKAEFDGTGGDLMRNAGVNIILDYRKMAFMGFVEVIANIRTIFRNMTLCKEAILNAKPDALILIDYPGFNMRIAEWAKKQGLRVIYYISPQVWAWKQGRVKKLKATVDLMLNILPFEKDFYLKFGMETEFVGHPLLDELQGLEFPERNAFLEKNHLKHKPIVALLPGSRTQEISRILPLMNAVSSYFPEFQFVIAAAPGQPEDFYRRYSAGLPVIKNQTYHLLHHAEAALVTSGTATLETALLRIPEVVCYKAGNLSYQIARRVIKVPYISLVNLIMNKEVVKELIQDQLSVSNLTKELNKLLKESDHRTRVLSDYDDLILKLGGSGASDRAAELIVKEAQR